MGSVDYKQQTNARGHARECSIILMHEWVQRASPFYFVPYPKSTTHKNLSNHYFPSLFLFLSPLSLSHSHRHTHTHTKPTLLYSLFKLPSSSISFSLAMVVETMPCLVHHLLLLPSLLLLLAAAGSGVHCIGEKKVVSLEALQWRKNSLHQPVLPQRSSKI